jgi:hypothetical protein
VAEHHSGCFLGAGVAVCGVGGNLFVAGVDELDAAFFERGEHRNVGVTAQAKNVLNATVFEVLDQLMGNQIFHLVSKVIVKFFAKSAM